MEGAALCRHSGRLPFAQALRDIATGLGGRADDGTLQGICDARKRTKAEPFARIERPVLTMIDHLRRRGLGLGTISNCVAEDVTGWPTSPLASRFDCAVFSFEIGAAKPDPAVYIEAITRLGVDASEAWFVGDGGDEELPGASQVGLRPFKALWFLKRWPHFREQPCSAPTLETVEELIDFVDRPMGAR
jgi:FMN phosphatase YigB (HAD superfamily)